MPDVNVGDDFERCPNPDCGVSLRGSAIPQDYIDRGYYGEGATHYSRKMGVELRGVYDGVLFWVCPDCDFSWVRNFGSYDSLNMKSLQHVMERNAAWREEQAA